MFMYIIVISAAIATFATLFWEIQKVRENLNKTKLDLDALTRSHVRLVSVMEKLTELVNSKQGKPKPRVKRVISKAKTGRKK